MTARQPSRSHSAEQQISIPLLCGPISNFTSAYSPLRHHLEGTATCGKTKSRLQRNSLRLLPRVPRQSCGIPVHAQLLRAPRAQLVLRQHAENRLANHPVRLRLARPLRPWLRTSSLHSVTPFPVKTNSNLRVCALLCQRRVRLGSALILC